MSINLEPEENSIQGIKRVLSSASFLKEIESIVVLEDSNNPDVRNIEIFKDELMKFD